MKWKEIGKVSVDSGMVMITDPCRVVSRNEGTASQFSSLFKNWKEFARVVDVRRPGTILFPSNGLPEMAVVSATGVGDGAFPVMALIDDTVPGSRWLEEGEWNYRSVSLNPTTSLHYTSSQKCCSISSQHSGSTVSSINFRTNSMLCAATSAPRYFFQRLLNSSH